MSRKSWHDSPAGLVAAMLPKEFVQELERALRDLRYGTVQLVVHDAQVVRIERLERIRLTGSPEADTVTDGRPTATPEDRHEIQQEA